MPVLVRKATLHFCGVPYLDVAAGGLGVGSDHCLGILSARDVHTPSFPRARPLPAYPQSCRYRRYSCSWPGTALDRPTEQTSAWGFTVAAAISAEQPREVESKSVRSSKNWSALLFFNVYFERA